ncbi:hypothetical protein WJX72_003953 [[Myrmecia] bisecta]|uniref:Uncharacterized protein n=1 Tax=[Myrmecia] bisecta TaxID=41462 RepID=A0AAW1R5L6_9CHLO
MSVTAWSLAQPSLFRLPQGQQRQATHAGCSAAARVHPLSVREGFAVADRRRARLSSGVTAAFGHHHSSQATKDPDTLVQDLYDLAQNGKQADTALVTSLSENLQHNSSAFGPAQIAKFLWAVAKMGLRLDPKVLAALTGLVAAKAHSFKPAQIAAVLWALGTLGQKVDPGVISALGKAIANQASNFDPSSLVDALWGFAKVGGKLPVAVIGTLARRVKDLSSHFKPQEAANALWALVKLDEDNGGNAMKAILAVGAGGLAIKAVQGAMHGSDSKKVEPPKQSSKDREKSDKEVERALHALSKSGADPETVKAMREAAKKSYKDAGHDDHDSGANLVDAMAALRQLGHEPKEEHHSRGLAGAFKKAAGF